jgi:4-amino-4-deoxy-L-arabinose transferase-like glycosyltransferase
VRIPLLLYGLALAVRLVLIAHFPYPAYPDSAYYADVASSLHAGQGFNVDFIWIFAEVGGSLPADPVLPIPSNAHWMPLASIVQVPFLSIFGDVAWAAALPFALIGALAAPLIWGFARDAGASRMVAIGAGILTAIPLLSTVYLVQPDNFSLFQPLVLGSLWLAVRGLRGSGRAFIGAGLLAGLATLARTDGVLVLATLGLLFAWDRWRAWRSAGGRTPAISVAAAVGCVAVFVLVMAPWWARQLAVFGSLSPSSTSGKVLFIRDIGEWNSSTTPATLDHLLGMGIGPLLVTRLGGLVAARRSPPWSAALLVPLMVVGPGAPAVSDFRPFLPLCRDQSPLRPGLGGPRPGRHVHPLGRRSRSVQLRPRARGHRAGGGLGRVQATVVGFRKRDPDLLRSRGRVRGAVRCRGIALRPQGVGGPTRRSDGRRRHPRCSGRAVERPGDVHRCLVDEVLVGPRRGRPGQRPDRDHP